MNNVCKRIFVFLISAILIFSHVAEAKTGVVLALSGGGLRGVAHLGAVRVLLDNNIKIAGIVGTSMGSLMGGLLAIGYSPEEIKSLVDETDLSSYLAEHTGKLYIPTTDTSTTAEGSTLFGLRLTQTGNQRGPLGFFTATKLFNKFTDLASGVKVVDFAKLPIPFAAVATDINTGEKVVLQNGSIASAMRASMAVPGVFEPWRIGNQLLVDGGLVSNLPVITAKELFEGYPVVAIDVSDVPGRATTKVQSLIDVIDRSLTILTHKNVIEERALADVVITPDVSQYEIFDQDASDKIFDSGVKAAREKIDEIIKIAESRNPAPIIVQEHSKVVKNVQVSGVSPKVAASIRAKYLYWIGKELNTNDVIEASREIAARNDLLTADYRVEFNTGGAIVVFEVVPMPDFEIALSGYTTNIHPYRGLQLKTIKRSLFADSDSLTTNLFISEEWAADLAYRTTQQPFGFWQFRLTADKWILNPENYEHRSWVRYAAGFSRSFKVGGLELGLGYAYERINLDDDVNGAQNSSGPVFHLSHNTLDVPSDPSRGSALNVAVWWANFDELLFRVNFFKPFRITDTWRANFRLGYAEGSMENEGHMIYLGSAEELYSVAGRPIAGERAAWANIAFRRVLGKNVLGTISGEIFGGLAYVWDENGDVIKKPWEAGIALSVPNNLVDTKLALFYTSEKELRLAFFLGTPFWGHYPLP